MDQVLARLCDRTFKTFDLSKRALVWLFVDAFFRVVQFAKLRVKLCFHLLSLGGLLVLLLSFELGILFENLGHVQLVLRVLRLLSLLVAGHCGETELRSIQNTFLTLILQALTNLFVP